MSWTVEESRVHKVARVPLSDHTITRWIDEIENIEAQLLEKINALMYRTIQVHEFTNADKKTLLLFLGELFSSGKLIGYFVPVT